MSISHGNKFEISDMFMIRKMLEINQRPKGWKIASTANRAETLLQIKKRSPKLITTSIVIPGMSVAARLSTLPRSPITRQISHTDSSIRTLIEERLPTYENLFPIQ